MTRPRVAIVGTGIAGLGAAHLLAPHADLVLFEADNRLGGHTNTRDVPEPGAVRPVDTGFIVHNRSTYPRLIALFEELGVKTQPASMAMSICCDRCGLQYASERPWSIVRGVVRNPSLLRLLLEIWRFRQQGSRDAVFGLDPAITLAQYVADLGLSTNFANHYLIPVTAAVWSAPPGRALEMPADYILGFMRNHGMLGGIVEWRTVTGGSREYVVRLERRLRAFGAEIRLNTPVRGIERDSLGVTIRTDGASERFDHVVIAAHADQAIALLDHPTPLERELLGPWAYTSNDTVLHTDARHLPPRAVRASWNYRLPGCTPNDGPPTLSYWMNALQDFSAPHEYLVTLNGADQINPASIVYRTRYTHPRYTTEAVRAQRRFPELAEVACQTRTSFCGAYHGFGFHEDGLASGMRAAEWILAHLHERTPEPVG